jgi:glycosyltransferase involved in cell wall biosynthesis
MSEASRLQQNDPLDTPLVSVVVPVYNAEAYLSRAIDSILGQTYTNLEVIAVDDGSTDTSAQLLAKYTDRLQVISQENSGSAQARNAGIERSRGKYVAFLDADDYWHPEKLRLQVAVLERNPDIGLVYNDWIVVHGQADDEIEAFEATTLPNGDLPIDEEQSGWVYYELLWDSIVHTSAAAVRTDVLKKVGGFDGELRKGQDYDLWLRLSRETAFRKLDLVLSVYRIQDQGVTQKVGDINYGALILERALAQWGRRGPDGRKRPLLDVRTRLAGLWYSFGWQHFAQANYATARASFLKSWRYCPWRLGSLGKVMQSIVLARQNK